MTTAPPVTISGTICVYVVPCEPLDLDQAAELGAVLESFLDALALHILPGTLLSLHAIDRGGDGKVHVRFDAADLELGAMRVLHGMLAYFAVMVAPLGTMMAWSEPVGTTPNLLDTDAPLPQHRAELPFETRFAAEGSGAAPPLVVDVVFGRPLTNEEKDRLDDEVRVWAALVQGGYPEPGDLPGSSTIGPLTVRYDDPQTLHLHAEALLAGDACLVPLEALVAQWSRSIPVVSLVTA